MQAKELLTYIQNTSSLKNDSVNQLSELVKHYPYFQPAHLLYCLATKEFDIANHQEVLKKTAISIANRVVLHNLLNKSVQPISLQKINIAEEIQQESQIKTVTQDNIVKDNEEKNEALNEIKTALQQIKEDINVLKATELSELSKPPANADSIEITQTDEVQKNDSIDLTTDKLEDEIQKAASEAFLNETYFESSPTKKQDNLASPTNFMEWINFLNAKKGATAEEIKQTAILAEEKINPKLKNPADFEENSLKIAPNLDKKQKNSALIDKIIQSNPGAIRTKDEKRIFAANAQAKESLLENEHLVTETLAKIYALQGHISKAIRAYEILSLKIPQKSVYFASLIKELKEKQ